MSREILFRGKRTDNCEWVYGNYCYAELIDKSGYEDLIIEQPADGETRRVIPETVGQYTGLMDKNGKMIFEGDVVYCKSRLDNANMVVIFECGQFRMVLSENYRSYQTNSGFYDINCFDKKVIGNIHDNKLEDFENGC